MIRALLIVLLTLMGLAGLHAQSNSLYDLEKERASGTFVVKEWNEAPSMAEQPATLSIDMSPSDTDEVIAYIQSDEKMEMAASLMDTYERFPEDQSLWPYVLLHYGMSGENESLKEMAAKMRKAHLIPAEQLLFHKILLSSLDGNDVLISHGLWDTATLLIASAEEEISVTIISLEWLKDSQFRSSRLATIGLQAPRMNAYASKTIKDFQNKNPSSDIHLTLTQNKSLLNALTTDLKLCGLTFTVSNGEQADIDLFKAWELLKAAKEKGGPFAQVYLPWHRNYLPLLNSIESYSLASGQTDDTALSRRWMNEITDGLGIQRIPPKQ